jgi:hypothetical protein
MTKRLQSSSALGPVDHEPGATLSSHERYMRLLRAGAKHGDAVVRAFGAKSRTQAMRLEAEAHMASGAVIMEVESAEEVDAIPLWMQGDASLQTEEKLRQRQQLRYDRNVLRVLQKWWEAAQRSLQSGGDLSADTLHEEGHAMMLRRIYRVMIQGYNDDEAAKTIAEDWRNDTKGEAGLSRRRFCDAFFELGACPLVPSPTPARRDLAVTRPAGCCSPPRASPAMSTCCSHANWIIARLSPCPQPTHGPRASARTSTRPSSSASSGR